MIIKLIPLRGLFKGDSDAKVVSIHCRSGKKSKTLAGGCSQLCAVQNPLCPVVSTKLKVIFRNYN